MAKPNELNAIANTNALTYVVQITGVAGNDVGKIDHVDMITKAETLQNKTISAGSNTLTNIGSSETVVDIITGQTDLASGLAGTDELLVSDAGVLKKFDVDLIDTYMASTTKTLTNKTLTSPVLTLPQINDTSADHQYIFAVNELAGDITVTLPLLSSGDTFTFNNFAATLQNKSIALGSNTLTGTTTQFNTALTAASFAFDGGAHHDGFSDAAANDHIDHTAVTITVAATSSETTVAEGAQDISASRTFTIGIADDAIMPGTGGIEIPQGNTAQRLANEGVIRVNSQTGTTEIFRGAGWRDLEAGVGDDLGDHIALEQIHTRSFGISFHTDDLQTIVGDAGGTTHDIPTGLNYDFQVNSVSVATIDAGGIDIAASDTYAIAGTDVLTATALGTGVLASSLTSVGILASPVLTTPQINDASLDHQFIFAGAELVADRTVTLPDLSGNDTFVFEADTQTLTNKTLTSPVITSPTLTLTQSATPTPTAEGVIEWDTGDHQIAVGDSVGTKLFSDDSMILMLAGGTMTGELVTAACTASTAMISIPSGTAPSSPAEGDLYYNGTNLFFKPSGAAVDLLTGGSGDMILASAQQVTGAKTFDDATMLLDNVAGTFTAQFSNTNTANRTYTLQNSSDILVGRDTTDTLTNKSIDGATNTITNVDLTGDVTGDLPLANLAQAGAWTFALNNSAGTADLGYVKISALTDRAGFGTGDKLIIEESTGEIRKVDYDDLPGAGGGANTNLGNLTATAINLDLISDTDIADDLGTEALRWKDIYAATIGTGQTATDTFIIRGYDTDAPGYVDILTITANPTVTADLHSSVTQGGSAILLSGGALGTPSSGVATNLTGTASGLTAGTATDAVNVGVADETTDTTCFPLFVTAATGDLPAKSAASLTFNSNTGALGATSLVGALTGNADTATALETARTIGGTSFDGTANIVPATITIADESVDTSCNVLFVTAATGDLAPKSGTNLTFDSASGLLTATGFVGPLTGNADTVTTNANLTGEVTSSGNAASVDVSAITGQSAAAAFASGDKFLIASGGALEQADFDDLPGGGDVTADAGGLDSRIAVWTGTNNIEGDADFLFTTASNTLAVAPVAGTSIYAQGGANILADSPRGTMTLSNIDALDTTTEATIEAAIDTLANLTAASALVTVGALTSGSIASGFGSIDIAANAITATGTWTGPSGTWDAGGIDIATGDTYAINGANVIDNATTLSSGVVTSSLTTVGTLTSLTMGGDIAMNGNDITDVHEIDIDGIPDTDQTANGPVTSSYNTNTGYTSVIGDLVMLNSSSKWALADASAEATADGMLGIALTAVSGDSAVKVALKGSFVRDDVRYPENSFVAGDVLYMSETAGEVTPTAPTTASAIVRIVGYAPTLDVVHFTPDNTFIEV